MQIVEVDTEATATTVKADPPADAPPTAVVVEQHRIYVWSSPSPFAVVIDQRRSFLTRG